MKKTNSRSWKEMETGTKRINEEPLFSLGGFHFSDGVESRPWSEQGPVLWDHQCGHWGLVDPARSIMNLSALSRSDGYVLSIYPEAVGVDLWVVETWMFSPETEVWFYSELSTGMRRYVDQFLDRDQFVRCTVPVEGH